MFLRVYPILCGDPVTRWTIRGYLPYAMLTVALSLPACGPPAPVRPNLPPSESDLVLLKSTALCDRAPTFHTKHSHAPLTGRAWGSGQEIVIPADKSPSHG